MLGRIKRRRKVLTPRNFKWQRHGTREGKVSSEIAGFRVSGFGFQALEIRYLGMNGRQPQATKVKGNPTLYLHISLFLSNNLFTALKMQLLGTTKA